MKVFVLPEAEQRAAAEPEHRQVLERFIESVHGLNTMGELVALQQVQRVSHPMFKWKIAGKDSRIIFRVSSSPDSSVLYAAVFTCVFHGREYRNLGTTGEFSAARLAAAERLPEYAAFIAGLDAVPVESSGVPREYIGMRRLPAVLEPRHDGLVVEESEDWVEKVLSGAVAVDGTVDSLAVELSAGAVIDAVLEGGDNIVTLGGDTALVETISGTMRVSLGSESTPRFRRRLVIPPGPEARDYLVHAEAASAGQVDPFLLWHPRQEAFLKRLSSDPKSLPAFIDGPGGSGKTAILMWLVRGVLQHRSEYADDTRVRFVTVSPVLASKFAEGLHNHLVLVDGFSPAEAAAVASSVCRTVDEYLLEFLPADRRARYVVRGSKLDWRAFRRWFGELHPSQKPRITPHEAWCALRALVRGDKLGRDDLRPELSRRDHDDHIIEWFDGLVPERRQSLDREHIRAALNIYKAYTEWKAERGLWDEADLVEEAVASFAAGGTAGGADLLVVDEAQDLTPDTVRFLVRSGGYSRYRLDIEYADPARPVPLPVVFAADDLQTINPSGFEWGLFRAVFYEETAQILNRVNGVAVDPGGLDINFRMRENVHAVAHSVRRWLKPSVPADPPEHVRTGGYSGPCPVADPAVAEVLGAVSRIIVPLEPDTYEEDSPVRRLLDACKVDWERVLPVTATKGDEFGTVALVGFAGFVRAARPGQEARYARQITYVAASRARDVAVWIEPDDSDRTWFWEGDDGESPARYIPRQAPFQPAFLDPFRMSSDQVLREELMRLVALMRDTDDDDGSRAARASAVAANIRLMGLPEHEASVETAESLARYFRGDAADFRVTAVVPELQRVAIEMAARDRCWAAFSGPHPASALPNILAGWALRSIERSDLGEFFVAASVFSGAGVSATELLPDITSGLMEAAGAVFGAMRQAADAGNESVFSVATRAAVQGAATLLADPHFARKTAFFADWSGGHTARALAGARDLQSAGDVDTAMELNRSVVVKVAGVPWVSGTRVPAARLEDGMTEAEILASLESACLELCSARDVLDRFVSDTKRAGHRYTDVQVARFLRVAFAEMAAETVQ